MPSADIGMRFRASRWRSSAICGPLLIAGSVAAAAPSAPAAVRIAGVFCVLLALLAGFVFFMTSVTVSESDVIVRTIRGTLTVDRQLGRARVVEVAAVIGGPQQGIEFHDAGGKSTTVGLVAMNPESRRMLLAEIAGMVQDDSSPG